jgi:hypothetical protein
VERREDEVTRLGDRERRLDRLEVAHLADEHDVRILAQDVLERVLERAVSLPTSRWFTMRELVRVQVLDRVLDGDDVEALLGVDLVDDGRERRRLARARRPGHEHEPAGGSRARPRWAEARAPRS